MKSLLYLTAGSNCPAVKMKLNSNFKINLENWVNEFYQILCEQLSKQLLNFCIMYHHHHLVLFRVIL